MFHEERNTFSLIDKNPRRIQWLITILYKKGMVQIVSHSSNRGPYLGFFPIRIQGFQCFTKRELSFLSLIGIQERMYKENPKVKDRKIPMFDNHFVQKRDARRDISILYKEPFSLTDRNPRKDVQRESKSE